MSLHAFPRNLVLAASAGTGKTHALVGIVVSLLIGDRPARSGRGRAQPLDPSRVVATTFSRKAAAEIRVRVSQEIERLASAPSTSVYVHDLRGAARDGRPLDDDDIRTRARAALARLPAARFGTLHSFATGIVKAHAVELGLGPGFELAAEADARARADDAIARALEARLADAAAREHVRALADAAGGVDELVGQLRRVLVRLEEDGRAARDLGIASDDVARIEADCATFVEHARALVAVARWQDAAGEVIAAWKSADAARFEQAAAALAAIPAAGKKTPEAEAFAIFRKALPGATNDERGRRLARAYAHRHRFAPLARLARDVLADAEAEIERAGRARASIGFGEILRACRELLRDRADVAVEIASGIDALLVDEFQDTSRVQRDLLQLLWARDDQRVAGRVPPLSAVRASGLLVVGDRKQSIYGFRGADVGVFAELAVGLAGAPAREALGIPAGVTWEPKEPLADFHALRHNRRSVAGILAFANAFSARRFRPGDPPPELFEIDYVPETEDLLVPPELPPRAEAAPLATTWLRVAPKGTTSTRLEEALVIADRARAIVAGASPRVGREARAPSWRDIAVLATTNGMLDAVSFALAQAEIPYVVAGKSFFRTREVRDLAAMLAIVLEPQDRLAALEVLRGPWVSAHDETLLGLTRAGEGLVPPHAWATPPSPDLLRAEDRAEIAATGALVVELARCAGRLGPGEILREAVRARALDAVLAALPRGEQRVANVRKLLAIADRHTDARAFRAWLDQASEQEVAESEAATFSDEDDAVRLLTIHASKGLDFPIVFIPEIGAGPPRADKGAARIALGAGDEPNTVAVRAADAGGMVLEPPSYARAHATARRRDRAERQRLAYVAVTRAADAMFLVGGTTRESAGDPAASTLAVISEIAADPAAASAAGLAVEDVAVPADVSAASAPSPAAEVGARERVPIARPTWRSLPIAPTALADFDHCARRFELVHLLGLPEHVRGSRPRDEASPEASPAKELAGALDARAQGTLAHAVLERVPVAAFSGEDAEAAASRALVAEGIASDHAAHAAIVARVARFLRGSYAQRIDAERARVRREVAFVLSIDGAPEHDRAVVLRGNIDLVVEWPDGSIDVVDYKSARGGAPDAYAFQLDVYALAARAIFPAAPRLRAGLVFLGGASAAGEPAWRSLPDEREVRRRLARIGDRMVDARWSGAFPRVALERCESIHCGFIGRCHASTFAAEKGTDEKPPRATTT
ncbi:MAG: UvrD-helicase domain-containing protein [Labilithrix sp.]|nr:UvrD-helicase domain-containing protein [Labilithrix sp.]